MERGNPIERRGAVIPDAPLLRQFGHRVQLVLDHAQVTVIDRVSGTDAPRRQAPRPNPPADSLGVPTQPIGSFSNSQHAEDGRPSPGPRARATWAISAGPAASPRPHRRSGRFSGPPARTAPSPLARIVARNPRRWRPKRP